ncbi:MAG TPA: phosphoglycerate mutase [Xanthomonadales bacterium]|nr:phosphoglycerate mutase [Xanthomonadales bacterium]
MHRLALLLPARPRPGADGSGHVGLSRGCARLLARADVRLTAAPGQREQLRRWFELSDSGWPMAAITRQLDVGDAQGAIWLRADPAFVKADINGGRMLACGTLGLDADSAASLVEALQPMFAEAGCPISAPAPERWYLRLPVDSTWPQCSDPEDALGDDLIDHLPGGPAARRWRVLMNEAQIILHTHPINARRSAEGAIPVNSLWFWGAGSLPERIASRVAAVHSAASDVVALARLAGLRERRPGSAWTASDRAALAEVGPGDRPGRSSILIDLRHYRAWSSLQQDWLEPLLADLVYGRLAGLELDCADGSGFRLERRHRWRFWRRPLLDFSRPA